MTDNPEETIQEMLDRSMPSNFGMEGDRPDPNDHRMTSEEMHQLSDLYQELTFTLLDRNFSESELKVVVSGIEHQLRAGQFDPYEYDRIALTLKMRETVEEWKESTDEDIPEYEIAHALDDLSNIYMQNAREKTARREERSDNE